MIDHKLICTIDDITIDDDITAVYRRSMTRSTAGGGLRLQGLEGSALERFRAEKCSAARASASLGVDHEFSTGWVVRKGNWNPYIGNPYVEHVILEMIIATNDNVIFLDMWNLLFFLHTSNCSDTISTLRITIATDAYLQMG